MAVTFDPQSAINAVWCGADGSATDSSRTGFNPQPSGATSARKIVVLLVEDNRTDVLMVEEAIELQGLAVELHVVEDGEKACEFLERADCSPGAVRPEVLLLDLNLPKRTGKEVLMRLRGSKTCPHIPVVIITSADVAREREELMRLGIARYFRKPANYDEFMQLGAVLQSVFDEMKLR